MTNYIQYGGAIFKAECPRCHQIVRLVKTASVNSLMRHKDLGRKNRVTRTKLAQCKEHGRTGLVFVGFEKR